MRILLALLGAAAAALIPAAALRVGLPRFWSQAIGILVGWALMLRALTPAPKRNANAYARWAIAFMVATVIALVVHRGLG